MKKIKPGRLVFLAVIVLILGTIWSNNHVVVDDVTIAHNRLPASFDNYKILQISDLHGKEFGKNQKKLIDLINKQQYNLAVFTGDYGSEGEEDSQSLENILKGMPKNKEMYYILGDKDADNSTAELKKGNPYYDLFLKYGVEPLYPGKEIRNGNESIWLKTNPYVGMNEVGTNEISAQLLEEKDKFEAHYEQQQEPFTIEISHRPTEIDYEESYLHEYRTTTLKDTGKEWRHWDISLNGHTHRGNTDYQFIGPLYAPNYG